jgi:glycosyltransferase involved in cell wall biosynthesis
VRREPTTVLLVVPWDQESGGVTSVARTLATSLQEAGHRPLFLFPGDDDRVRRGRSRLGFEAAWLNLRAPLLRGRRLHSLAGFLAYLPLALRELLALVRRERVSVVNVHYPIENGFWFALLRRLAPVRLVTSLHGSDVVPEDPADPPPLAGTRQLLRASDAVVAPSEGFARIVRELFPFAAARTIGIPNAELASLVGGHPFIVCVAEYTTKKGHDVLVPAFARLRAAGREPLRLLLIGDGVLRDDVQRLVVAHGLADRVVFAGRRSPALVARALARAELFVLPSRAEPFGMAVVEAMAVGAPVVVTAAEGPADIVRDGETGLVVPVDDGPALERALARLLDDRALARRLGDAGAVAVRHRHARPTFAQAYLERALALATARHEAAA